MFVYVVGIDMPYAKEDLAKAVFMVKYENGTIYSAGKAHGVPYNTIKRHVSGNLGSGTGANQGLTSEEEDRLASYIVDLSAKGFSLTAVQIRKMAFDIAEASGRRHNFNVKSQITSWQWFDRFKARHQFTLRVPENLANYRASCNNRPSFDAFFRKVSMLFAKSGVSAEALDPSCIWNMDETGLSIVVSGGKVVAKVGAKQVFARTFADRAENHTLVTAVAADGSAAKPMVIFKGTRIDPELQAHPEKSGFPNCTVVTSPTGWINSDLFLSWLESFVHGLHTRRPVFLFLDGHGSHVSMEAAEMAKRNGIHLQCFPSHTTSVIQPCDRSVFKSLKSHWRDRIRKYIVDGGCKVPSRSVFLSLLHGPYCASISPLNIKNGFKRCGLYPFNPQAITDADLAPSTASEQCELEPSQPTQNEASQPPQHALSQPPQHESSQPQHESSQPHQHESSQLPQHESIQLQHGSGQASEPCTSRPLELADLIQVVNDQGPSSLKNEDYIASVLKLPKIQRVAKRCKPRITPSTVCLTLDVDDKDVAWRKRQEERKRKEEKKLKKPALKKDSCKRKRRKITAASTKRVTCDAGQGKDCNDAGQSKDYNDAGQGKDYNDICPRCSKSFQNEEFGDSIQCLVCKTWLHMLCEGVDEEEAPNFVCCDCFC